MFFVTLSEQYVLLVKQENIHNKHPEISILLILLTRLLFMIRQSDPLEKFRIYLNCYMNRDILLSSKLKK